MLYLRGSEAADELSREIDARRAQLGRSGTLPRLLFFLARAGATRDRWGPARSAYAESTELAAELGQVTEQALSLAGLAWLEARTGAVDACAEHAERALALAVPRSNVHRRGVGRLRPGRVGAGRRSGRGGRRALRPARRPAGAHRVRRRRRAPRARAGRVPRARRAARRGGRRRRGVRPAGRGQGSALGVGAGRPGAGPARRAGRHRRGVRRGRAPARPHADLFETARSRLLHGQRLRRSRRRADAREPLRDALEAFERLGAGAVGRPGRRELDATGSTVVRRGARRSTRSARASARSSRW